MTQTCHFDEPPTGGEEKSLSLFDMRSLRFGRDDTKLSFRPDPPVGGGVEKSLSLFVKRPFRFGRDDKKLSFRPDPPVGGGAEKSLMLFDMRSLSFGRGDNNWTASPEGVEESLFLHIKFYGNLIFYTGLVVNIFVNERYF